MNHSIGIFPFSYLGIIILLKSCGETMSSAGDRISEWQKFSLYQVRNGGGGRAPLNFILWLRTGHAMLYLILPSINIPSQPSQNYPNLFSQSLPISLSLSLSLSFFLSFSYCYLVNMISLKVHSLFYYFPPALPLFLLYFF